MLFNWKWEGLEQVMDWVAVVSAISAVVLLVVEIIRGINEKKKADSSSYKGSCNDSMAYSGSGRLNPATILRA